MKCTKESCGVWCGMGVMYKGGLGVWCRMDVVYKGELGFSGGKGVVYKSILPNRMPYSHGCRHATW